MKTKQLKYRLKMIETSPLHEPFFLGEITIAVNVLERVKNQVPTLYKKILKQLAEESREL